MQRGRIKKTLCDAVMRNIVVPNIEADKSHSYQSYLDLNKAHIIMLDKQGIISNSVAKDLLAATQEMAAMGDQPSFFIDPKLEGMYFNLEKWLIEKVGLEVGGQMHTARSRNDMIATLTRMDLRRYFILLCEKTIAMRKAILGTAKENLDAVMAGYTHLQPSEPITFAHFCSGILAGLERDYKRISQSFERINLCPMGAGSMGSTTWNIDRKLISDLLGFDDPMDNSVDAIGSRDYVLEVLAAITIMGGTLSRLCHDLYVWATPEYGYIEVDDSVAICSSIMPQKKNPYTLEYIKGRAGNVEGFFVGSYAALKNTPYSNVCDVIGEGTKYAITAVEAMIGCCELMEATISTLKTNRNRMLTNALGNFCTVTELANSLVRHDGISFRAAHEIVALIVGYMIENSKRSDQITTAEVNKYFQELFHRNTSMTDEQIQEALNPISNAESKTINGGTAKEEVSRQLKTREEGISADEEALAALQVRLSQAKTRLEEETEKIIAS